MSSNATESYESWSARLARKLERLNIRIDDPLAESAHRAYQAGHTVDQFVADWLRVTGQTP